MNEAYGKLIEILDDRKLRYLAEPEMLAVRIDYACRAACHRLRFWVEPDADALQLVGYVSARAPVGCRPSVAETIARANWGVRLGRFEMDLEDGEMRYQVAHVLGEQGVYPAIMDRMINVTLHMLDTYLPAIMCVIYANEAPQDAIRDAQAAGKVTS